MVLFMEELTHMRQEDRWSSLLWKQLLHGACSNWMVEWPIPNSSINKCWREWRISSHFFKLCSFTHTWAVRALTSADRLHTWRSVTSITPSIPLMALLIFFGQMSFAVASSNMLIHSAVILKAVNHWPPKKSFKLLYSGRGIDVSFKKLFYRAVITLPVLSGICIKTNSSIFFVLQCWT